MVYVHYVAVALLFLIGVIIGWKIYVYLISATQAVQQSVVGHYFYKFLNGVTLGVIFVVIYLWATGLLSDGWNYFNSVSSSKNAAGKSSQIDSERNSAGNDSSIQVNGTSFNCSSPENQTQSTVCSNPSLVQMDVSNNGLFKRASTKNENQALEIKQAMINERDACGTDQQCIYFSYEKSNSNYKQMLGI